MSPLIAGTGPESSGFIIKHYYRSKFVALIQGPRSLPEVSRLRHRTEGREHETELGGGIAQSSLEEGATQSEQNSRIEETQNVPFSN